MELLGWFGGMSSRDVSALIRTLSLRDTGAHKDSRTDAIGKTADVVGVLELGKEYSCNRLTVTEVHRAEAVAPDPLVELKGRPQIGRRLLSVQRLLYNAKVALYLCYLTE